MYTLESRKERGGIMHVCSAFDPHPYKQIPVTEYNPHPEKEEKAKRSVHTFSWRSPIGRADTGKVVAPSKH